MNTGARILTVDDELNWRQNFARWISDDLAVQDSAATALEAASLIRKFHYDLVLLDLSMDVTDHSNRDNRPIQEYLAAKPEGTRFFIVSSVIRKEEVYRLGDAWVFFKSDLDRRDLAAKAAATIADAANHRGEAILVARKKLVPDQFHESRMFGVLEIGLSALYSILDVLLRAVAPVAQHGDRPVFIISSRCVMALFWSRRNGTAVSVVLAHQSLGDHAALGSLEQWLGFSTRGATLLDSQLHNVRILAFEEPSIDDAHFDLPVINLMP
jgi:CheY-like chemotaxis protein